MASKRFLMVPVDSSAARMPRPGAVMASATLFSSARFIALSLIRSPGDLWTMLQGAIRCVGTARLIVLFYPQHLHTRQGFPFHPLQEGASGCGHIGKTVRHARGVQRGDG